MPGLAVGASLVRVTALLTALELQEEALRLAHGGTCSRMAPEVLAEYEALGAMRKEAREARWRLLHPGPPVSRFPALTPVTTTA